MPDGSALSTAAHPAGLDKLRRVAYTRSQGSMAKPKTPDVPRDIAILQGPTEDGEGRQLLRLRDGQLSVGEIRPVKEGQPLTHQELVRLRPLEGQKNVCEIEVLHEKPSADPKARSRPARVATDRYRKNWTTIFDVKRKTRTRGDWSVN